MADGGVAQGRLRVAACVRRSAVLDGAGEPVPGRHDDAGEVIGSYRYYR